ncbi:O-antigen ligase family protein [Patescibacteria group bacterium]
MLSVFRYIYISGIVIATLSLISYFFDGLTYDNRLRGFYLSPNFLSMYLSPVLIIGLWGLFSKDVSILKRKSTHLVTLLLISLTIFLTYSYAAWLAVALSVIITLSLKSLSPSSILKVFLAALIGFAIIITSQLNNPKFTDIITLDERSSLSSRIMIWQSTTKILGDNWVLGIGPGEFQNKYLEYQQHFPPYLEWAVPHPHNIFAAFWVNSGLVGLLSFTLLITFWFKDFFSKIKKDAKNSISLIFICIILYILIHGLVDTTYWKNDLSVIFWMIFFLGQIKSQKD